MHLRVIDYVANAGGGIRFAVETLRALASGGASSIEVVSHGAALGRYRALLGEGLVRFVDLPPANRWRAEPLRLVGLPGEDLVGRLFGAGTSFHFDIHPRALEGADVVWLPWLHRHRLPREASGRVVASLHDLILIDFKQHVPEALWRDELETVRRWLDSPARVVVSSQATAAALRRTFAIGSGRVEVVPLSGDHADPAERAPRPPPAARSWVITPANTFVHKNHEVLFEGYAAWGGPHALVLTGAGADLRGGGRAAVLRRRAGALGLRRGENLFPLGYVDEAEYAWLLRRAWALVMPTLAEGGGSFPVLEALRAGVPVISADIPVMREMIERVGGEVLWFDPASPAALALRLAELEAGYAGWKSRAAGQVARLRPRGWQEVAADYRRSFEAALRSPG